MSAVLQIKLILQSCSNEQDCTVYSCYLKLMSIILTLGCHVVIGISISIPSSTSRDYKNIQRCCYWEWEYF